MQNSNGLNMIQEVILIRISDDTRHVLKIEELLTSNHLSFLDKIRSHGKDSLIDSLRTAHDSIAYDSNVKIDKALKNVLFDLKILKDWLEKI